MKKQLTRFVSLAAAVLILQPGPAMAFFPTQNRFAVSPAPIFDDQAVIEPLWHFLDRLLNTKVIGQLEARTARRAFGLNLRLAQTEAVSLSIEHGAARITLHERMLTLETLNQLAQAVHEADSNGQVHTIFITGIGNTFSRGVAFEEGLTRSQSETRSFLSYMNRVFDDLADVSKYKTTIALINGVAEGAGAQLALACTYRVAAPQAVISFPEVQNAIIPGGGGTQRLPRLIGATHAAELILTPRDLRAREARSLGLVDWVADNPAAVAENPKGLALLEKHLVPRFQERPTKVLDDLAQEIALRAREIQYLRRISSHVTSDSVEIDYAMYLESNHDIDTAEYMQFLNRIPSATLSNPDALLSETASAQSDFQKLPLLKRKLVLRSAHRFLRAIPSPEQFETRVNELRRESESYAPTALAAAEMAVNVGSAFSMDRGLRLEFLGYIVASVAPERDEALRILHDKGLPAFDGLRSWPPNRFDAHAVSEEAVQKAHDRIQTFIAQARKYQIDFKKLAARRESPPILNDQTPRDGFQALPYFRYRISNAQVQHKLSFIRRLAEVLGARNRLEASASDQTDAPRIAQNVQMMRRESAQFPDIAYVVYTPEGARTILEHDADAAEISVMISASPAFSAKMGWNPNALAEFESHTAPALDYVRQWAHDHGRTMPRLRGYVNCAWGYFSQEEPFLPSIDRLKELIEALYRAGVREIVLCDTVGRATPPDILPRIEHLLDLPKIAAMKDVTFAVHFHDGRWGLLNTLAALQDPRIKVVDTALANTGGSYSEVTGEVLDPGNVALSDLVFVLNALDVQTGIPLSSILEAERELERLTQEDFLAPNSPRRLFGLHRVPSASLARLDLLLRSGLMIPEVELNLSPQSQLAAS